jgi:hypothetical protein
MAGIMLTAFAYAQSSQLKGKWVLESATVVQNNNGSTTNLDVNAVKANILFGLYDELVFADQQLTLVFQGKVAEGPVTVTSNMILTNAAPAPLSFSWKIEEGALYLVREYGDPSQTNISYKVSSVYINN